MAFFNVIPTGRVWTHENRVESDGDTREEQITGLPEGALEPIGRLVVVDGKTKLNGLFDYEPFLPGRKVTSDGFDQVQLYSSLNAVQEYLLKLGFDPQQIIASQHGGKAHPIAAHANATSDLNAWFSPQSDDLTFGTAGDMDVGEDTWHLASDSDVTVHEGGHLILYHVNKKLSGWWTDRKNTFRPEGDADDWDYGEGRAIHEAFGDMLAALFYNDPEMSEDFLPALGRPASKTDGLRIVDNNLTLDNVTSEEHDRGRVYAGFFWSIKKQLGDPMGPFKLTDRQAADLTLKIVMNHASNYDTSRPKPYDFVSAVVRGSEALAAAGRLGVDLQSLKYIITAEAVKRKLIPAGAGFRAFDNLKTSLNNDGSLRFIPEQRSIFWGGSQEIYQQQYRLSSGSFVDVISGGAFVERDAGGRILWVSTKDVRQISPNTIDETISVNIRAATTIAFGAAQKQLHESKNKTANMMLMPMFMRPETFYRTLKEVQMEQRIFETAIAHFNSRGALPPQAKLVIAPGSDNLSYEIKVGLGFYYVDAKTGAVTFKRDVVVN